MKGVENSDGLLPLRWRICGYEAGRRKSHELHDALDARTTERAGDLARTGDPAGADRACTMDVGPICVRLFSGRDDTSAWLRVEDYGCHTSQPVLSLGLEPGRTSWHAPSHQPRCTGSCHHHRSGRGGIGREAGTMGPGESSRGPPPGSLPSPTPGAVAASVSPLRARSRGTGHRPGKAALRPPGA